VSGDFDFLIGGGDVGALMRAHNWASSPLGSPETWPQSLRSVVGLLLGSKFPMFIRMGTGTRVPLQARRGSDGKLCSPNAIIAPPLDGKRK